MSLAYILLALISITIFCTKNLYFIAPCIVITNLVAISQGIIDIIGITWITTFVVTCYLYFHLKNLPNTIKIILFSIIMTLIIGFYFHLTPGFYNKLVINRIYLSLISYPFSMYLNFDKAMAAMIIYITSGLYIREQYLDKKSILQVSRYFIIGAPIIIITAYLLSYIKYDPKIPNIITIWVVNNLLFVCVGEEIVFRGFIQEQLKVLLKNKIEIPYLYIILSAIIFGLYHFSQGITYVLLASISGIIYGFTYEKTNRLLCSILIHFGVNLTHLLLFTYPVAIIST